MPCGVSWVMVQMSSWDSGKEIATKESTLQQIMEFSHQNDSDIWSKVRPQAVSPLFLVILRMLDDMAVCSFISFGRLKVG